MFLFLTVTYIPQEKGRITAIILPAMLTILLYQTTFIGAMHGMILLSIRLRFHIFGGMNDGCLYQQFIVLPLILALGVFVVRRGHSRP